MTFQRWVDLGFDVAEVLWVGIDKTDLVICYDHGYITWVNMVRLTNYRDIEFCNRRITVNGDSHGAILTTYDAYDDTFVSVYFIGSNQYASQYMVNAAHHALFKALLTSTTYVNLETEFTRVYARQQLWTFPRTGEITVEPMFLNAGDYVIDNNHSLRFHGLTRALRNHNSNTIIYQTDVSNHTLTIPDRYEILEFGLRHTNEGWVIIRCDNQHIIVRSLFYPQFPQYPLLCYPLSPDFQLLTKTTLLKDTIVTANNDGIAMYEIDLYAVFYNL